MITPNEYQQNVLKTECEITPELLARVASKGGWFVAYLNQLSSMAGPLDDLKKYGFYGKSNKAAALINSPLNPEKTARLQECVRLLHSVCGITTEAAELAEALMSYILHGGTLDTVNIMEEFGDVEWYSAQGSNAVGYTSEQVLTRNNEKLAARYKGGFTAKAAIERNLEVERDILENGTQDTNT